MKPLSNHWADICALKVIKSKGEKEKYVVASGITPSGLVHVGNFREVITVDLVARALRDLGKQVEFIYSWDNFDTFRKVPKNLPDPKAFESCLRKPIARIPDPWGEANSYASGRIKLFEDELKRVGIAPAYRYQEQLYSSGVYAENIRFILENTGKIKAILNQHRTSPLEDDWLPSSIYCSECQRDNMHEQKYLGEWSYYYHCAECGFKETVDIRTTKNLKLVWRVDWPMRWHYEKVDFEPGGKDHSSDGGSFDTGKEIIKELWNEEPPMYLQYDFVMIKGGTGKMSSSSGQLFTLSQVLEVYEPHIVRWIFAGHRPNHDFSIAFDEDVIKIYDEFDRAEKTALSPQQNKADAKWEGIRRTYELSLVDRKIPENLPYRAGFRVLCNRLQICSGDIDRTFARYYASEITDALDIERFYNRAKCALNWLNGHASEEFRYCLHSERIKQNLTEQEDLALVEFRSLITSVDLDRIDPKELNELIWEKVIKKSQLDPKQVFLVIYRQLIGRDQGPRLPSFLKEIGKERLLELI